MGTATLVWISLPATLAWGWWFMRRMRRWPDLTLRPRLPFRAHGIDLVVVLLLYFAVQLVGSQRNPYLLSPEDITNWDRFRNELRAAAESTEPSPAHRIFHALSPENQQALRDQSVTDSKALHVEIVRETTQLLGERSFYTESDFANVTLRPQLRRLLSDQSESLSDSQVRRMNRMLLEAAFPGLITPSIRTLLTRALLRSSIVILLVPFLLRQWSAVPLYQLGIHGRRAGYFLLYGTLSALAWMPLVIAINVLVRAYWPQETLNPVQDFFFTASAAWTDWALVIAAAVVIAPLQEELLFRSLLQTWFVNRIGVAGGILFAGLLFGLAHSASWPDPLPLTVLGVALGLCYQKTRSLWAPVAMHGTFNGLMVLLSATNPG